MLDPGVADHERVASMEGQTLVAEGRQAQGAGQLEALVAQDPERQMEPLDHLALVGAVLRRKPEHPHPGGHQLRVAIAVRAGLRGAAACAWDRIPDGQAAGRILTGTAGPWIGKDDDPLRSELIETHDGPVRCEQPDRWDGQTRQVVTGAVVERDRKIGRKRFELVSAHERETSRAAR